MEYIGIIPSRYGSTRLHAKALRTLCGKELFWHVYTRAKCCSLLKEVYIATDDERIATVAKSYDIPYILTSTEHTSGTDRVFEAAQILGLDENTVIANIQGDEPLLHPNMLTELLLPFQHNENIHVTTLCTTLLKEDIHEASKVKVVTNIYGDALYFSRSPLPYNRTNRDVSYKNHIGLYAFRYSALEKFVSFPPCMLEEAESLEQLRFLYNGINIHVAFTEHSVHSIDEEKDIAIVEPILQEQRSIYGY